MSGNNTIDVDSRACPGRRTSGFDISAKSSNVVLNDYVEGTLVVLIGWDSASAIGVFRSLVCEAIYELLPKL